MSAGSAAGARPEHEPRGVANHRIVDRISPDRETGEIVLAMLEDRPWGSDPDQLRQLEAKIDSYLVYVLDGFFHRDYPRYQGLPVRLRLECAEAPGEREWEMLAAAETYCREHGLVFGVRVVADPMGGRAPWEGETGETGEASGSGEASAGAAGTDAAAASDGPETEGGRG